MFPSACCPLTVIRTDVVHGFYRFCRSCFCRQKRVFTQAFRFELFKCGALISKHIYRDTRHILGGNRSMSVCCLRGGVFWNRCCAELLD